MPGRRSRAPSADSLDHGRFGGQRFGHALERRHDLLVVDDAMQQPVGNVLAGNAQGGTILHQADVVDIRDTFEQPTPWSIQRTT